MSSFLLFLLFMIPGTVALGVHDVVLKRLLSTTVDERLILAINMLGTSLFGFVLLLIVGFPVVQASFWPALLGTALLNIFGQWFWYKALQAEEVSLISPMRLLTPPLVLVTGFLLLKEVPTVVSTVGIFITLIGLWFLFGKGPRDISLNMQVVFAPGTLFAFGGAFAFAFSFPLDKIALLNSSALFTITLLTFAIGVAILVFGFIRARNKRSYFFIPSQIRWWIPLSIAVYITGAGLTLHSLQYTLVGYASGIKRLSSLWAVLFAGAFLREKDIGRKLIAVAIMLIGVMVIALGQ